MRNRRESGFTLMEVLIVAAVLAIIIAIVLPAIASARKHTNESAAVANLRSVSSAQLQYRTRYGDFGDIDELETASLLDASYEDGMKTGYEFISAENPSSSTWSVTATPVTPGVTGDRFFFIDESGVIRYREGESAGNEDSAVD
jgi:prepilin-type N-terminal cleavage/methylation domain-containing protein